MCLVFEKFDDVRETVDKIHHKLGFAVWVIKIILSVLHKVYNRRQRNLRGRQRMFALKGSGRDSNEMEARQAKESVLANAAFFLLVVAAIRVSPFIIKHA